MNVKANISNTARKELVARLIRAGGVESQAHLSKLLAKEGIRVTQATISRDLEDLRAIRQKNSAGVMQYQLPTFASAPTTGTRNLILEVNASGNLAVVKTPSGGAQLLASAIDRTGLDGFLKNVIGTIAGDDTVVVISKSATGGSALAKSIETFAKKGR